MDRKQDRKQLMNPSQSQEQAMYGLIASILDEILICRALLLKDQFANVVWPLTANELLRVLQVDSIVKYAYRVSWVKCFNNMRSLKRVSKELGWTFVETDQYKGLEKQSYAWMYGYMSDLSVRLSVMEEVLFFTFRGQQLSIMDPDNREDGHTMKALPYVRNENCENVLHILFSLPDHDIRLLDLITRILQTFGWTGMEDLSPYCRLDSPLHRAVEHSLTLEGLYDKISVLKSQNEDDFYKIQNILMLKNWAKCTALHVFLDRLRDLKKNDGRADTAEQKIIETLSCSSNINAQDIDGRTPLHCLKYSQIRSIKLILNCKPDLSVCNALGNPPFLSLVLKSEHFQFDSTFFNLDMTNIRQLMEIFPSSAVYLPNSLTKKNIVHLLAEDSLRNIHLKRYDDHIEELLSVFLSSEDAKTALVARSNDEEIPLNSLIRCFTKEVAPREDFIFFYYPPNLALHQRTLEKVLSCIISGNINLNKQDDFKKTILHYLVESYIAIKTPIKTQAGNILTATELIFCDTILRLVQKLVARNADVNVPDIKGNSVQDLAYNFDEDDLIKSLRRRGAELAFCIHHEVYLEQLSDLQKGDSMRQLKHYRFHEDKVAEGCMGEVYVAINEKDLRELALKRVKKDSNDSKIKSEIKALCYLSQKDAPNIVHYYELMEDENFYFIALELMDGDLNDFIQRHGQSVSDDMLKPLCRDILRGIKYLHDQQLLHRDIKPGNVLYTTKTTPGEYVLKICDFGLVKNVSTTLSSLSYRQMGRSLAGTRGWMAPELVNSVDDIVHTKESDIFAMGLVVHFLISLGRHPFQKYLNLPPETPATHVKILPYLIEFNIAAGNLMFYENLGLEEQDFLSGFLATDAKNRKDWNWIACHPFLWSTERRRLFLSAVGDQIEVAKPQPVAGATDLAFLDELKSSSFAKQFHIKPWIQDKDIASIKQEMENAFSRKKYDGTSITDLIRFFRNACSHLEERCSKSRKVIADHGFVLGTFKDLVFVVYKSVKRCNLHRTREKLKKITKPEKI